jgi:hypothetical protein
MEHHIKEGCSVMLYDVLILKEKLLLAFNTILWAEKGYRFKASHSLACGSG